MEQFDVQCFCADDSEEVRRAREILNQYGIPKTLCFTGHRSIPERDLGRVIQITDELIEKAFSAGYRVFLAGGAVGFDTVAAFRVLAAKKKNSEIKLLLVLPCRNQTEKWTSERSLREYQIIKKHADGVVYVQDKYDDGCMFRRNRFLVDKSSCAICYLTRSKGGSAYTASYAQSKGKKCVNVADRI